MVDIIGRTWELFSKFHLKRKDVQFQIEIINIIKSSLTTYQTNLVTNTLTFQLNLELVTKEA